LASSTIWTSVYRSRRLCLQEQMPRVYRSRRLTDNLNRFQQEQMPHMQSEPVSTGADASHFLQEQMPQYQSEPVSIGADASQTVWTGFDSSPTIGPISWTQVVSGSRIYR
jgi:hypothetical protein